MKARSLGTRQEITAATPRLLPGGFRQAVMGLMLTAAAIAPLSPSTAHAALSYSGNLNPGNPALWTTGTNAYVGQTADGSITVDGGTVLFSRLTYQGYNAGVTGTVTVTGAGSKWTGYSNRVVGMSGTGVLNILSGGTVSNVYNALGVNAGSSGTINVDGAGSKLTGTNQIIVAQSGTGVLNITNGGYGSNTNAYLGYDTGSTGTVTVDGSASKWANAGTIYVGRNGTGTLNILNGSTVTATVGINVGTLGTVNFGSNGGTLVTNNITGSPSQFTGTGSILMNKFMGDADMVVNTAQDLRQKAATWNGAGQNIGLYVDLSGNSGAGDLAVGHTNNGSLAINNGLGVVTANAYVGYNTGSTGTATVNGTGSKWTTSALYVGHNGTGTVNVANGASVSSQSDIYIGNSGVGTLNISGGGSVSNASAYLGYNAGSTGTVTVDGAGSTWTSNGGLYVGQNGTGTLNILNGSAVSVSGETTVGTNGRINFGTSGGTLTTSALYASAAQLSGTGTINTAGIVGDVDLVFDGSHGASQALTVGGTTVNLNQTSSGVLGVGYLGTGNLTMAQGVSITSKAAYLGYNAGSVGTATLSGAGTTWTVSGGEFAIGRSGNGVLNINNGATFAAGWGNIGFNAGSTGTVNVDGAGSRWTNTAWIDIGYSGGTGHLNITNGGIVTAPQGSRVAAGSTVTVDGAGSRWDSSIESSGLVTISNGATATGYTNMIGCMGPGTITVDGAGSKLDTTGTYGLYVGTQSGGTLNILNGAGVNVAADTYIGRQGKINFSNGGTLTTGTMIYSPMGLSGSGTINASGIVADADIRFDASHGASQSLVANGVTINLNQGTGALGVGYLGNGNLTIADGVSVSSNGGWIGGYSAYITGMDSTGANGTATVTGPGTTWNTGSKTLYIGYNLGTGSLKILNGASVVSAGGSSIGTSAHGTVLVDGMGSKWTTTGRLSVGGWQGSTTSLTITNGGVVSTDSFDIRGDTGRLVVNGSSSKLTTTGGFNMSWGDHAIISISDGGTVSTYAAPIPESVDPKQYAYQSMFGPMSIDVGRGSSFIIGNGTGTFQNSNTLSVVAGAGAANGTYTPIQAGAWNGTEGTVNALGGIWDAANHTITVSSANTGAAGSALTNDLATTQRYLFTDGSTGNSVGVALKGTSTATTATLTATAISGSVLGSLQGLLGAGQAVLSAWDITATEGYVAGDPAYLSLSAASGRDRSDLTIWHYDGSVWSQYDAFDLAYDNTYASFIATGFSGYAVSGAAPVPIPAAAWLLGSGVLGLVGMRRKKRTC